MAFSKKKTTICHLLCHSFEEANSNEVDDGKSNWDYFIATFKHMQNPYQILIMPLTLWSGFQQGSS